MPYAERIPQKRCTKTRLMPSARATAQACCGPAPPNAARTCAEVSCPLLSVIWRIGRHIASSATFKYPSAISSGVSGFGAAFPSAREICASSALIRSASRSNERLVASWSRGWDSSGPKIFGKYPGCTRPSSTFASVTERRSPPLR